MPLVSEAVTRWASTGITENALSVLRDVHFAIADIPGSYVGLNTGTVIWIDQDAASHGWFIDSSPSDDLEFGEANGANGLRADDGSPASRRMDLLTVIAHELGHVLGSEHSHDGGAARDLMASVLEPGVRRLPRADAIDSMDLSPCNTA